MRSAYIEKEKNKNKNKKQWCWVGWVIKGWVSRVEWGWVVT